MSQKLYFLATDKGMLNGQDLWVTDGTTTEPVGGLDDMLVSDVGDSGLGPSGFTVFGQQMLFAGSDALNTGSANGLWLTDGTAGGTKEIGGVSPGTQPGAPKSPFEGGNPNGLSPNGFVSFGTKAIFFGNDADDFTGLWVTDGTVAGTIELGGLGNEGVAGKGQYLSPENLASFNNSVLFDAYDGDAYKGLWITDGTTAGTEEIGGPINAGIADAGVGSFIANDFITLGSFELFNDNNAEGDSALWITDGTAAGTVEIGGMNNAGIVGADNTDLGAGLANSVRLGDRIFFSGNDNDESMGLWTTDGTVGGTTEIGGLSDAGLKADGQHPSSVGLTPTDLTVNGPQVLFEAQDALGFKELWASDGTAQGTYEIGGEAGAVAGEAVNGLDPSSIVSLGNGKAVFIGADDSNNQSSGRPTLWVTDGSYGGTQEIGGSDNLGVAGISQNGGFTFTNTLIGGDGLAYFVGADADGNQVLWETDGTLGGTKVVADTLDDAPATGISPSNLAMGPVPTAATNVSGSGETINLESIPGEEVNLSDTSNVADTVNGSNGTVNLSGAQAALIGGGLLVSFVAGVGNAVGLYKTNGNKDSVYGSKGAVTLNGAQANVIGIEDTITFATGTSGNVVYISETKGVADIVNGSGGTVYLTDAQATVNGGGDTIDFVGSGDSVTLSGTAGAWDQVNGSNGTVTLTNAQASVIGGGDIVDLSGAAGNAASLYSTSGNWDAVYGSNGTIYLNSAQTAVSGGGDTIDFGGSGDAVSLYSTAGAWDVVNGSSGTLYLFSAQAVVAGGGDTINFAGGSGNAVTVSSTAGKWDAVNGSAGTVYLTSGQAVVTGGGDTVGFVSGAGNAVTLSNTSGNWDAVNGSGGAVYLTSGQAVVTGGSDTVAFVSGAGDAVTLSKTSGSWDAVNGSNGTVYLTSGQAVVTGGADTVGFVSGSGNAVTLSSTANKWDTVNAASGTVYLSSAQAAIVGGGNAVVFAGGAGNTASLYGTGGNWDSVTGSNGSVYLNSAQAGVSGSQDTIFMAGSSSLTQGGASDAFVFQPAIGHETINGFAATDSMQFSASDFANWSALLSHVSQSGANTLITLDASDQVTLTNVTATSLAQSQFHFV